MGAPLDIKHFATLLTNSGLISEPQVQELVDAFQAGSNDWGRIATAEAFCDFLVDTDRLTRWQCDKLLMGKWKGFYLDSYVMMDHMHKSYNSVTYKARDTRDDGLVCLVITPVNLTGGQIVYRVEPYVES
jgi:hypothetical protein